MNRSLHPDQSLLPVLARGDAQLLEKLYQGEFPKVRHLVVQNSGDEDLARDLFQDALMVLFAKARDPQFELRSSLSTYLYAIARNLWLKKLRKTQPERVTDVEVPVLMDESAHLEADEMRQEARRALMLRKLAALGEGCRDLLRLVMAGKRMAAIVEELGLSSEGYARKRKFKCKEQLTRAIQADPMYSSLMES